MNERRRNFATLGLLLITFLAAIQYIFLQNVPSDVTTFSFLCISNLVGLLLVGTAQFKCLKFITKRTLLKGCALAALLCGFNFFLLIGSRNLNAVVISSVLSMYFVFITPIMLFLRQKVSFRSVVASIIAIIALLLMFEADTGLLFQSKDVVYLVIADLFFAVYVISISFFGKDEHSIALTLSQMLFCVILSFAGWIVEAFVVSDKGFFLPTTSAFWISTIFIGVFIRGIYGIVQMTCQKYVQPINASLIYSSEIIMTLITNPFLCRIMNQEFSPATIYQIIGCGFFVFAVLIVDDGFMGRLGYNDMDDQEIVIDGQIIRKKTISRKLINITLSISTLALVAVTLVSLTALMNIKETAVNSSLKMGIQAADTSGTAMISELEDRLDREVEEKAKYASERLASYGASARYLADYAQELTINPDHYDPSYVEVPNAENAGVWTMQRALLSEEKNETMLKDEIELYGNMQVVFQSVLEQHSEIAAIYMGTAGGLFVSYDKNSDNADSGVENYYNFFPSEWYEGSQKTSTYGFTDTYQDNYGRGLTITIFAPFFDMRGKFKGCVAMDILMSDLNNAIVSEGIQDPLKARLISKEGILIASEDMDPTSDQEISILDESYRSPIASIADEILKNNHGIVKTQMGEESYYTAYATIAACNWTICVTSPESYVTSSAVQIQTDIEENADLIADSIKSVIQNIIQNCLVLVAFVILIITAVVGRVAKGISDPLKHLTDDVEVISNGEFSMRTNVATDDEIGILADAFNNMTDSLQNYIKNLKDVTAKEERIASELTVATTIQASMLPNIFPAFPDRDDFDIYATMTPAKEVGGDFYDFFLIDDRHLAIVMADVSGKGVPAALFMVIGKTLIKDHTTLNSDLGNVFTEVNNLLCEANSEGLFITAFEGVLDLETGEFTYVNAGHEIPFIYRKGEGFTPYKLRTGFVLAGMEGVVYRAGSMTLHPGDKIFQYTDGVPEATDASDQLFGMSRLEASLNKYCDQTPQEILKGVKKDVDEFVGTAEQFDDITMLCLEWKHSFLH